MAHSSSINYKIAVSSIASFESGDPEHEELKFLLHTISEICFIVAEKYDVTFSKDFVNYLGIFVYQRIEHLCQMLEYFAKHAKRTEIIAADLKLYFRTSSRLTTNKLVINNNDVNSSMQLLIEKFESNGSSMEVKTKEGYRTSTASIKPKKAKFEKSEKAHLRNSEEDFSS